MCSSTFENLYKCDELLDLYYSLRSVNDIEICKISMNGFCHQSEIRKKLESHLSIN